MSVRKRKYTKERRGGKKPHDTWMYDFTWEKVRYKECGFRTRAEAEKAEQKKRHEIIGGAAPGPPKSKVPTLLELAVEFFEYRQHTVAKNTFEIEKKKSKNILHAFGNRPVSLITTQDIQQYVLKRRKQGRKPRTINLDLALMRAMFDYAVQCNFILNNPAKTVKNLREQQSDKPIPTDEELQRFIAEAEKSPAGRQLVTYLWVGAYTGMRPSECFHLQWADIDFKKDQIFVRPKEEHPTKTGKFRVINIHPVLKGILLAWQHDWNDKFKDRGIVHDWVFFHPRRPAYRAKGFRKSFNQAKKKSGVKDLTPYTLRHYFISKAIMSGIDTFTIAKWSGHGSTQMIDKVYGHLSSDYKAAQMAKISIGGDSDGASAQPAS